MRYQALRTAFLAVCLAIMAFSSLLAQDPGDGGGGFAPAPVFKLVCDDKCRERNLWINVSDNSCTKLSADDCALCSLGLGLVETLCVIENPPKAWPPSCRSTPFDNWRIGWAECKAMCPNAKGSSEANNGAQDPMGSWQFAGSNFRCQDPPVNNPPGGP